MTSARTDLELRIIARDEATRVLQGINKDVGGLGSTLGGVTKVAGGFLAAGAVQQGVQAFTGFMGDSVNAASELQESVNAVNQIFDESAQQILDWGKENANSFGLSQASFNQMATPLGAMLKNAGLSLDDVTGSTIDLTKRAADMASVFNTDVDEALAAIQAGLRGEADPLERYGVSLSAAKVESKALAMSGKTLASELTEQEKAMARVALIMEQTNDVSGDFQATSDGLANSQRIAAARTEELQAQIGAKLIPVTEKITELKLALITVIAEKVIPTLEELYAKHWPSVQRAIQGVVSIVEEWWPRLQPIFAFVFDFFKTQVEGFIQQAKGIIQIIEGVVDFVSAVAHGDWAAAWTALKDIAEGVLNLLEGTVKRIFGNLPGIIADLAGQAASAAGNAFAQIPGLIEGVAGSVLSAATSVGASIVDGLLTGMKALPGLAGQLVASVEGALKAVINQGIDAFNNALPNSISIPGPVPDIDLPDNPIPRLAQGHPFIPFDNFPALLHRGERVLTAEENRQMRRRDALREGVTVVLNNAVINARDKEDARRAMGDIGWAIRLMSAGLPL